MEVKAIASGKVSIHLRVGKDRHCFATLAMTECRRFSRVTEGLPGKQASTPVQGGGAAAVD